MLPAPVLAACRKGTESGTCSAYALLATAECTAMCPYVQGGNCSMPAREAVCRRNRVRCMPMVRTQGAWGPRLCAGLHRYCTICPYPTCVQCMSMLSWFCDTEPTKLVASLEAEGGAGDKATEGASDKAAEGASDKA